MRPKLTLKSAEYFALGAIFLAGLVAVGFPGVAEAQRYRDDVPNVLPKPSGDKEKRYQRNDERHLGDFSANYRNQKSPRIAVFWNRRLQSCVQVLPKLGHEQVSRDAQADR